MLITKDEFLHFANRLKHCYEEREAFHKALGPYFERPIVCYGQRAIDGLEDLLVCVSECEEEDGIFSWWLFESPKDNKIITVKIPGSNDEEVFDCSSAEGLYEYLVYMYHKEK